MSLVQLATSKVSVVASRIVGRVAGASRNSTCRSVKVPRVTSISGASVKSSSVTGLTVKSYYSTQFPTKAEDNEDIWEDLNGISDFYDPRFDSDHPEEEGGNYEDISDEEYARLLGLIRGQAAEQQRFPPGAYEDKFSSAKSILESSSSHIASSSAKDSVKDVVAKAPKHTSIDGEGAATRFRIGTLNLPKDLLTRIREVLKDYPRAWLKRDSEILSNALRARTVEQVTGKRLRRAAREGAPMDEAAKQRITVDAPPIEYDQHQAMAYVAHRIPGIFGCNTKVFDEVLTRFPGFTPKRMMDFGSGPGTTTWAASQIWPSIKRFQLVEPSDAMVEISTKLLDGFPVDRRSFLHQGRQEMFDLIVASYSLSELSDDTARRLHVRSIWEHLQPGGLFIIIEPGTPIGFKVVRQARSLLLELGQEQPKEIAGHIIGPCPHAHSCPMSQTSWCHFVQRVERNPTLKSAKQATQNWENEKFAYLAISKGPLPGEKLLPEDHPNFDSKWSRLIRQPLKRGGHVILDVCTPGGTLERVTVSRRHGQDLYTSARKSTWGDVFHLDRVAEADQIVSENPRRNWKRREQEKKEQKLRAEEQTTTGIVSEELAKLGFKGD